MKKIRFVSILILSILMISGCSEHEAGISSSRQSLSGGWQLFSAATTIAEGSVISSSAFTPKVFLETDIPSTVFNAQVTSDVYEDIYMGKNLEEISPDPFKGAWWYRNVFVAGSDGDYYELQFDGINYKANIWLNGEQIADTTSVNNAFKMYRFDVSALVNKGENILAIEVFPPKAGDFSIGFVDWNPAPPDNNMGIFRPVYLNRINKVQILEPYIESSFQNNNYSLARQNVSLKLKNFTDKDIDGLLQVNISGKTIQQEVHLPAKSINKVVLRPNEYDELLVKNPVLWWPHTIGEPVVHEAVFSFTQNGHELYSTNLKYGIREIRDYFTREGHRGFIINGEKISIRGGGWVDNLMLDNTHEYDLAQLEYVKSMNLNTIRLEGFWGKDNHLYETCDELGILVMVGWSCHWEWEDYLGAYCDEKYGGILSENDIDLMSTAWRDQLVWLRNHPSIIAWFSGSDCVPAPALEKKYSETFKEYDTSRVYLASAKEWEVEELNTGMKMRGPYAYVPPVYWFADTLYGGAFGFNTETGPGAQVPPLESIKKMIPGKDLWPINDVWDFHCGRNEFNTLDRYTTALNKRYGKSSSVEEYTRKAQLMNYELMRPMFEAFSAYRYEATGVIQWMLNSAWPEMYWQLYDSYLMPNGAFYGAKKASQPYHAIYDYAKHSVYVVNDKLETKNYVVLKVRAYDKASKLKYEKEVKINLAANASREILKLPEMIWEKPFYFLDLRLFDNEGNEIDNNFYWLSTKKDVLDYEAEIPSWYFHTPSKQYADFSALNKLPKTEVDATLKENRGEEATEFLVELKNKSDKIAFFIHPQIVDKQTGNTILPVLWSDNYISLLPGESRKLTATIRNKYLKDKNPELVVEGFNLTGK